MFCTSCGYLLPAGCRFCPACGAPLSPPAQQAPVGPPPMQQAPVGPPPIQQAPVGPPPMQQAPVSPPPMQQAPVGPPPMQPTPPEAPNAHPAAGQGLPRAATVLYGELFRYNGPLPNGPETILAAAQGANKMPNVNYQPGYWLVTNKRVGFILFDEEAAWNDAYNNGGDYEYGDFSPQLWMLDDPGWCGIVFPLEYLHSIRSEGGVDHENTLYLYSAHSFIAVLDKRPHASFLHALQGLVPGLTVVEQVLGEYNPSISERDPRNPLGIRYDRNWPRSYTVAHTKKLKKDPHGIDDAVQAAVQAGILPRDFDLAAHGIGKQKPPPGVPCLFHASF